jgi:hypothetical protein
VALLITPEGQTIVQAPSDPAGGFSLEEMYRLLDCDTIEVVFIRQGEMIGRMLVIDEKGKHGGKAVNPLATSLSGLYPYDWIVGAALLCEAGEIQ